jgi:hypothetical protein
MEFVTIKHNGKITKHQVHAKKRTKSYYRSLLVSLDNPYLENDLNLPKK